MRWFARVAALSALCACSASSSNGKSAEPEDKSRKFRIFVTTELKGQTEPCGCNSDPMGDLARTVELIEGARADGPVLVVDGGSLLYSTNPIPDHLEAQETLRADLLVDAYTEKLEAEAVGLGPFDLAKGPEAVRPPRHAANLADDGGVPTEPPEIAEVGGVKVGVFGVVSPAAVSSFDLEAGEPIPAARRAVKELRDEGARVVVALAHMTRDEARRLAREVEGVDFVVVGQNAPVLPQNIRTAPQKVGDAWLVQPADRGQIVSRLDVHIRDGSGPLADAIGQARAEVEIARLEERLQALRNDLAEWKEDPDADAEFIETKENELPELEKAIERLKKSPVQPPDEGSWFTLTQVPIKRGLPCDPKILAMKNAYDQAVGKANLEAAKGVKPPDPDEGDAGYVGTEECSFCHSEAVEFWKKTRHHQAWETLVDLDKQHNYDCIGCHVTGWDEPGGTTLAHNEGLRDVQCEVCHGPGSIHVDENGKEEPSTMLLTPPESLCVECHNEKHSDTFQYEAYLRNITGEGHGAEFRENLGDGPTGRELRRAALEKAGTELGKGCVK